MRRRTVELGNLAREFGFSIVSPEPGKPLEFPIVSVKEVRSATASVRRWARLLEQTDRLTEPSPTRLLPDPDRTKRRRGTFLSPDAGARAPRRKKLLAAWAETVREADRQHHTPRHIIDERNRRGGYDSAARRKLQLHAGLVSDPAWHPARLRELPERVVLPERLRGHIRTLTREPPPRGVLRGYRDMLNALLVSGSSYTPEEQTHFRRYCAVHLTDMLFPELPEASRNLLIAEWERRHFENIPRFDVHALARYLDRHFPDDRLVPVRKRIPRVIRNDMERIIHNAEDVAIKDDIKHHSVIIRVKDTRPPLIDYPNRFTRRKYREDVKAARKRKRQERSSVDRRIREFFRFLDHLRVGIAQDERNAVTLEQIRVFMERERRRERSRRRDRMETEAKRADDAAGGMHRSNATSISPHHSWNNRRVATALRIAQDSVPESERNGDYLHDIAISLEGVREVSSRLRRFGGEYVEPLVFALTPEGAEFMRRQAAYDAATKMLGFRADTIEDVAAALLMAVHRNSRYPVRLRGMPTEGHFRRLGKYWADKLGYAGLPTVIRRGTPADRTADIYRFILEYAGEPAMARRIREANGQWSEPDAESSGGFRRPSRRLVDLVDFAYRASRNIPADAVIWPDQQAEIEEIALRLVNRPTELNADIALVRSWLGHDDGIKKPGKRIAATFVPGRIPMTLIHDDLHEGIVRILRNPSDWGREQPEHDELAWALSAFFSSPLTPLLNDQRHAKLRKTGDWYQQAKLLKQMFSEYLTSQYWNQTELGRMIRKWRAVDLVTLWERTEFIGAERYLGVPLQPHIVER